MGFFDSKSNLGDKLVRAGAITQRQLTDAASARERLGGQLSQHLVGAGALDEAGLIEFMASIYDLPVVGEEALALDAEAFEGIPPELLQSKTILPLKRVGRTLSVALADPDDSRSLRALAKATGLKIRPVIGPPSAIFSLYARREALLGLKDPALAEELAPFIPLFLGLRDYRFLRVIAKGGFATVFQFQQISLNRPVALKVLSGDWAPIAEVARRFQKEGEIIARLDHPNIIKVYEQGEANGLRYIVMEYFEGQPLGHALKGRDLVTKLACLRGLASALEYAHRNDIVHRDIKPANVMVNANGQAKLLDFGIAHAGAIGESQLTSANVILGTPQYMAPELYGGARKASTRSDIYALGVLAYELFTETACRAASLSHPSQLNPKIPRDLGALILKSLHPDPESRPQALGEILAVIQKCLTELMVVGAPSGLRAAAEPGEKTASRATPSTLPPAPAYETNGLDGQYDFRSVLRETASCKTQVAYHPAVDRQVVIKLVWKTIPPERLNRLVALKGENIGEIYGAADRDGAILLVREYLPAPSLAERMKRPLRPREILSALQGIAGALHDAHKHNVVHGHLQPANVLYTDCGGVKVVDFGLFTEWDPRYARYGERRDAGSDPGDRIALGAMTFEMLTREAFDPALASEEQFTRVARHTGAHPLLKYFLGRLWKLRRYQPPYRDYADMLLDLARIQSRMDTQEEWIMQGLKDGSAQAADAA